jgi:hypothetical protein
MVVTSSDHHAESCLFVGNRNLLCSEKVRAGEIRSEAAHADLMG